MTVKAVRILLLFKKELIQLFFFIDPHLSVFSGSVVSREKSPTILIAFKPTRRVKIVAVDIKGFLKEKEKRINIFN